MLLLERAPEQEAVLSDEGSRINGILRELLSLSEPEIAPLVRTDGSLIAQAQEVQTYKVEYMGTLSALICDAAHAIAGTQGRSLSYVHQHGDKKDLLLLGINETFGLVIAFHQKLGLGGILYNARRSVVALGQIPGTGIIL
jgi:predicted regulator of Ras-like GTPase activity (Roadblock/LC7/MglB family)